MRDVVAWSASRFVARLAVVAMVAAGVYAPPVAAWPRNARVLVLSAFPTEGAKLLAAAAPATEVGVFNGRTFFAGTIAGKSVVMGLTGIGLGEADLTSRRLFANLGASHPRGKPIVFSGEPGTGRHIGSA